MQQRLNLNIYVTFLLCFAFIAAHWQCSESAAIEVAAASDNIKTEKSKNDRDALFILSDEHDQSDYDDNDLESGGAAESDSNWDVLIFTQQWPVTTCYHWREQDKTRECKLPQQKEFWTIHGIWPTKLGHVGPNFCNKTADFDVDQLKKIINRLETFWPDLEGATDEDNFLWKHEWLKHGTCAAQLDKLDNELKYFNQGLDWRDKFMISKILDEANIHPDTSHTVTAFNNAFVNKLGKNPSIHCLYDHKKDISYLAEIRICFNKTLELIDCDAVKWSDTVSIKYPTGTVNTNCHIGKPVQYPSLVPPVQRQREQKWKFPVVNMYKLLQFIMWFTL